MEGTYAHIRTPCRMEGNDLSTRERGGGGTLRRLYIRASWRVFSRESRCTLGRTGFASSRGEQRRAGNNIPQGESIPVRVPITCHRNQRVPTGESSICYAKHEKVASHSSFNYIRDFEYLHTLLKLKKNHNFFSEK